MRHRHAFENRYCCGCQCTTRHEVRDITYACIRCGAVKYPSKTTKPSISVQAADLLRVNCA